MNTIQQMYAYCKSEMERVSENFGLHEELALETMNKQRCSLQYADPWLYERMSGLIEEYCESHGLNPEDYDTEEVFWDGYSEE